MLLHNYGVLFCLDPNRDIEFHMLLFPGVAFSKHIVQTYTFVPNGDLRQQAEVCARILILIEE
jgi:hypothetical protein